MPAISTYSAGVGAISPRFFGMMASAYHYMPNALTVGSSSGPRRHPGRCRSQRPRWLICWKGSTGEIRKRHGDRRARAELTEKILDDLHFGTPQITEFMILWY